MAQHSANRPASHKKKVEHYSYPAFLVSQNQHRFYFATIPIDSLFEYCFVARRDEDPESGFQRSLSEARAADIAKYLALPHNSIPTNIVLSAQPDANFEYTRKTKSLSFLGVPSAFLVLDGQHRLWGYEKCATRHRVPVAIYAGLTRTDEARLFVEINTNQKGVPAALLLDIKHLAAKESTDEALMRELFDRLSKDPDSPIAGKLSPAKSLPNKLSRVTFNRAMKVVLLSSVLGDLGQEDRYKLIRNYLAAFDAVLADKRVLTRSAFFEAALELFDELVRGVIGSMGNAKRPTLEKALRPVANLDFSTSSGKSLTKTGVQQALTAALRKSIRVSAEQV